MIISDRIPLAINGGRGEGYRGYASKANYQEGVWEVEIETEDGRPLGQINFDVRKDDSTDVRSWSSLQM